VLSRHFDAIIPDPDVKIVDFDFTLANFGCSLYFKANCVCIECYVPYLSVFK